MMSPERKQIIVPYILFFMDLSSFWDFKNEDFGTSGLRAPKIEHIIEKDKNMRRILFFSLVRKYKKVPKSRNDVAVNIYGDIYVF